MNFDKFIIFVQKYIMFTGIIKDLGKIIFIKKEKENIHFTFESSISHQFKIDQSVSHNGVCLTVINQKNNTHTVTAIKETLESSNFRDFTLHTIVNLELCTLLGSRLNGHIVQGHIDMVGEITQISDEKGSYVFEISMPKTEKKYIGLVVDKGSIAINGVSLTCFDVYQHSFKVAIIPYTFENTNFNQLKIGSKVNLEFDIIGKYVKQLSKPFSE